MADKTSSTGGESASAATETDPTAEQIAEDSAREEQSQSTAAAVAEALGVAEDHEPEEGASEESEEEPEQETKPADGKAPAAAEKPPAETGTPERQPGREKPANVFEEPIPDTVRGKTRERMESMISGYNDLKTQHEDLRARHEPLLDVLNGTQANNQELALTFDYLRLRHSDNPEDLRAAFQMAKREYEGLAKALGEDAAGVDILAEFPDLKKRVEELDLAREDAVQLAQARLQSRRTEERSRAEREQSNARTELRERQQAAATQIDEVDRNIWRRDPDYVAKREILDRRIPAIIQSYAPEQWAAAYHQEWQLIGQALELAASKGARPSSRRQPLGGLGGGGGGRPEPKSAADAVDLALGKMPGA